MQLIELEAGRLFGERGYTATTLDDIAAAAGVTKPALYRHFESKRALYLALLARHRDDLPRFALEATDLPPEARMPAILDAWLRYVEQHGYAWRMLFRDTTGDPEIQAFRREVQATARETMAALIQSEITISPQQVAPLAEFLRAGGAALALWWLDHPEVPRSVLFDVLTRVATGLAGTEQ